MLSSQSVCPSGWVSGIHPDEVHVDPTQSIEVLGTQFNCVKMQFLVPRNKRKSVLRKCFHTLLLNSQHKLTTRKSVSMIGTLNERSWPLAPLHIWPLLHLQKPVLSRVKDWDRHIHLTLRVIQELEWWQSGLQHWNGKFVIPQKHQHILTTDVSGLG